MCPVSHVTCQVSLIRCHMLGVTCYVSCVMCHELCVICNISFFLQSGWVGWVRLCYQHGLLCQVLRLFCNKKCVDTQYLLISACSGPILVIKKSKLMRISFKRHLNRLEVPKMPNFCTCGSGAMCSFSKVRRLNQSILF